MPRWIGKLIIIGSDNGLSPGRRQAIIWTNAGLLLIGPLETKFSEILIKIHISSFKKMHLKLSSGKCRPSCLGLNVLTGLKHGYHRACCCPGSKYCQAISRGNIIYNVPQRTLVVIMASILRQNDVVLTLYWRYHYAVFPLGWRVYFGHSFTGVPWRSRDSEVYKYYQSKD